MYCGYITTIKELRKHDNADRLQCATVFGNNVVVDLSYKEGMKVVYFPTDGQLSEEFASENNLVRKKDENGNNIGGYLDPDKRNIKAINLRGEKSDGLILPIYVLEKYTDITKLKDGDTIDVLDGCEICRKYIPRANRHKTGGTPHSKVNKKEFKKEISYPYFLEHEDTAQLAYNEGAFRQGDTIYITRKLHGCFIAGTKIRMSDGTLKKIQNIKVGDEVLGYDFGDCKFKPTKVTQIFKNDKSNNWRRIKISRDGIRGDKRGYITATHNHPFYDFLTNEWIKAEDLKVGSDICTVVPSKILTKMQKEICVGMFLGDGYLKDFGHTARLETSQVQKHEEYIDYLIDILNGLIYKNNKIYKSGYGSTVVRAKTCRITDMHNFFENLTTFSSKTGENKLKDEIVSKFTPLSLAIFYMDDGSLASSLCQKDRANFAICDYNAHDANIIVKCFEKLGLHCILYTDPKGYKRIRLNHKDAYKMFDMIQKYIPPIMRYKLPEEYRELKYEKPIDNEKFVDSFVLTKQTVLENIPDTEMRKEYDMETELHNYVVLNSLVHNTSFRVSNAIEVTTKKRPKWIKKLFGIGDKVSRKYNIVSGSRRKTLDTYEGGFYGSNEFRKKYNDMFIGKLPKGMTVYGEIVGWINETTPIMPRCKNSKVKDKEFSRRYGSETIFTYGCEPGENDCYIYRITMTNEEGVSIELPTEETQAWCENLGVKYVPLLEKCLYTTWEDLNERCEKYLDVPEPLANGMHVTEGVVVRIDNRSKFTAYKTKSWAFKVLESIIKDTSDVPDMEEAEEIS